MTPGKYIPKPANGRRFVIADIHGCFETFRVLVEEQIRLTRDDQLFLLGDYLNRGPKPVRVLDYIMQLQQDQYQVFPLRGNHEQMVITNRIDSVVPPIRNFSENFCIITKRLVFIWYMPDLTFTPMNPSKIPMPCCGHGTNRPTRSFLETGKLYMAIPYIP